jgi:hypothetical protein
MKNTITKIKILLIRCNRNQMYTSFVYVVKDHTSGSKKKRSKEFVGGRRSLARVSERLGD